MKNNLAYRIYTRRLVVRCWQPSDAILLKEAIDSSIEHLRPWMSWAEHEPEPLEAKIARLRGFRGQFDLDQNYIYGIFNRDESRVIGSSGLFSRGEDNVLEIGYWIRASHINQGYATETAAALTKAAFLFNHAQRVEIHCDATNLRSAAIPQKLGYKLDATLRRRTISSSEHERDILIWSIFSDEFPGSLSDQWMIEAFDGAGRKIL